MIPTAEELLANNIDGLREALQDDDLYYFYRGVICEFAKEFAEMHITEALKQVDEEINLINVTFCGRSKSQIHCGKTFKYHNNDFVKINTGAILNAYPLELIK